MSLKESLRKTSIRVNHTTAKIWPECGLLDLEFNKVLQLISDQTVGSDAKELVLETPILSIEVEIFNKLARLEEFIFLLNHSKLQLSAYQPCKHELRNLSIENFVLSSDDVLKIYDVLINVDIIRSSILGVTKSQLEFLHADIKDLIDPIEIISRIRKIFDKDRNIRDEASEVLSGIRKKIQAKNTEIYKTFKKIVSSLRNAKLLAEEEEGIRNGRLVVRLLSEHRRKLNGIVHDRSEGGRTIYIEPQEIVELNNELSELISDEKAEIKKILFNLCNFLRPFSNALTNAYNQLVEWDILFAKAKFSRQLEAVRPNLVSGVKMHLRKAKHPLFFLKLRDQRKIIVPFSFYLNEKNRVMVISGPNAGGKSVTLKSVGLLQLMVQAGLFVPVDRSSEFRIFQSIMVDIGDHQSMDDELSTYSAKLQYMKEFLHHSNENTLVLIDEFGSGTEPIIGAAIAEAVLKKLGEKKVFAVMNTHYTNLKAFAHKMDGFVNAAMIFDEDKLSPTYQLSVGRPGSSYALEIAHKVKLPTEILDYAKLRIGNNTVSFENLLSSLDKEINSLKKQIEEYQRKQLELDRLISSYEQVNKQYEYKRLKLRLEQKQFDVLLKSNKQKELNAFIEEIQKLKSIEELEKKAEIKRRELESATHQLVEMNHQLHQLSTNEEITPLQEGDSVKMIFSGMIGIVSKIDKGRVIVKTDSMTFTMQSKELLKLSSTIDVRDQTSIQTHVQKSGGTFSTILDIRGLRLHEAKEKIDLYMDRALLANVNAVYIIHGVGNGILKRDLVRTLRGLSFVKKYSHPEEEGGGTTMVEFV
ncbi:MAG: Smr/MutS family protein [Saprospiraceae bacterium]|nr:Smr/MutS family protein [Saprospiraceae bacterium]